MPPQTTTSSQSSSPLPVHTLLTTTPVDQSASPLLSLPPEVLNQIYRLVLADYPDPSPDARYSASTCYTRPSYSAPRRCDTALLATCRLAYTDACDLPFRLAEQTHWLTAPDRAPPEYVSALGGGGARGGMREHSVALLAHRLGVIASRLRRHDHEEEEKEFEIESLRVFAQMYRLEDGSLAALLGKPRLRPRRVTLTVRHADWWFWERDETLRVEGQRWLRGACEKLGACVREVCVELESLERKRDQVDEIARLMRERWFFRRQDGEGLYADVTGGSDEVTRWSGPSAWNGQRWVRDESEEGRIDYYVVAVWFRPEYVVVRRGGTVSDEARQACEGQVFGPRLRLTVPAGMKRTPPGGAVWFIGPEVGPAPLPTSPWV